MARSPRALSRRGRPPSLGVAARRTSKLQQNVKVLLTGLEDLERRLLRLEVLLEANRRVERDRARQRSANHRGIRGKGPNVRDVAFQILLRRRRPMSIQELSDQVLKQKRGAAGENFTQNLGAALARDRRFSRVGRGQYTIRK
jgi:hypothetical protein